MREILTAIAIGAFCLLCRAAWDRITWHHDISKHRRPDDAETKE